MAATRPFVEFQLERLLSAHENEVEINLSESGVHPLTTRGLLEMKGGDLDADLAALNATELNYPQANGDLDARRSPAGTRVRPPPTCSSRSAPSRPTSRAS